MGTWKIDNLNSVDSSANRETLLNTFIVTKYATSNLISFTDGDKKVALRTPIGEVIGTGTYLIEDDNSVIINFPDDKIKSLYKITSKTDSTLKLTAYDDSETVNISLTKYVETKHCGNEDN